MTADGYELIVERLAVLDRKRERLENTPCVCGHEWHQHGRASGCSYRACPCEWFVAAAR